MHSIKYYKESAQGSTKIIWYGKFFWGASKIADETQGASSLEALMIVKLKQKLYMKTHTYLCIWQAQGKTSNCLVGYFGGLVAGCWTSILKYNWGRVAKIAAWKRVQQLGGSLCVVCAVCLWRKSKT